jgi:hypothetical protein
MSTNSIDQGMAESEELQLPNVHDVEPLQDLEHPARAWCDLVEACKLPVNSMAKNDRIKAILVEASRSQWTHELLDECEADTMEAYDLAAKWDLEHGNQEALPGYLSHEQDCDCEKCFKSRAKIYSRDGRFPNGKAEARTKVTARPPGHSGQRWVCPKCGQTYAPSQAQMHLRLCRAGVGCNQQ